MKYFNIASDFKRETIDEYYRLNNTYKDSKLIETYGSITIGNTCEGGRVYNDIPKVDIKALKSYIEYSKSKGIDFNYSLNGSCMGNKEFTKKGAEGVIKFLVQLYGAGVRKLTIALPSIMDMVKLTGLDFEIKVSIICQITNVNKAMAYKSAGVDRIVVDESLNRDFVTLKRIREAFGEKVEIIANSLCYKECTYRMFHYNQTAHDSVDKIETSIITYYNHKCMLKRAERVGNFFKLCWVRPEDIKYYTGIGIKYFKLQGRHTALKGNPARTLEAYFKETYDGNLIDLLELFGSPYAFKINLDNKKLEGYIKPFYEVPGFCKRDCDKCGYCELFAKRNIDYENAKEINNMAKEFYSKYDEYMDMIKPISNKAGDGKENEYSQGEMLLKTKHMNCDFDLE